MGREKRITLERGIYWDALGYDVQACVQTLRNSRRFKHARRQERPPSAPPLATLRAALKELEADLLKRAKQQAADAPKAGTMEVDAARYLARVGSMPSIDTRTINIGHWVRAFGPKRKRDSITVEDIHTQLTRFATESRANDKKRNSTREDVPDYLPAYSAATLRHLLNALRHMYSTLDQSGTDPKRNPAWAVPLPRAEQPLAGAMPLRTALRILRAMPRRRKSAKGAPPNLTRIRLALILTLGITQKEIARLEPGHIEWNRETGFGHVTIFGRKKGMGSKPRTLPITKHSRLALRAFIAADAWGAFEPSIMRNVFVRTCRKLGLTGFGYRPYSFRHTFATELYKLQKDIFVVQRFLGHGNVKTTERYILGSLDARMEDAQAMMNGSARRKVRLVRTTHRLASTTQAAPLAGRAKTGT